MYQTLLILHSINRWLVLASLIYAIWTGWAGLRSGRAFTPSNNTLRHVTATIAHVQLLLGLYLYMISPVVKFATGAVTGENLVSDHTFFQLIHSAWMVVAVVIITIGSAKAKRAAADAQKFRIMLVWFAIALIVILAAIPWPFSPLANRPYFRSF
ncbi:hypothetical protein GCM10010967_56060 [Dyadobacter beijingensis]|uniref:Cytochrome B n=1 Tax=Dyadobacter beijingensis TaxID=365489 RepID=A0ABQ2ILT2_9BACT|nr:hypothetical protein [Dyadobacter beijingensis]GGN12837.1 hypothetical protein GCM10010967_56060 [Dyadobacter beijingensis]